MPVVPRRPPAHLRWLLWDVDPHRIDVGADANYLLARILEFGGMAEVRWAIRTYGLETIHHFFRDVGHPELSERTRQFWRAALHAGDEKWAEPPAWRKSRIAPWIH